MKLSAVRRPERRPRRRRPAPPRLELLEGRRLLSGLAAVPFEGTGAGLLGHYFRTVDLTGEVRTRTDAAVNFNWINSPPPAPLRRHDFSVLWTGEVQPRLSETYTFSTRSDDGVRLWVNGRELVDDWTDHSARGGAGAITLRAGRKYDIVVEYYENSVGPALIQLSWSSASQAQEIVPQSLLYPGPPAPASLSGFVTLGPGGANAGGVAGATLTLSGEDDQGDAVTRTTTTAADGSYQFTGLRPGVYDLTRDGRGGDRADVIGTIRLSPGERGEGYDFTEVPPPTEPEPPVPPPPAAVPVAPPAPAVVPTRSTVQTTPPAVILFTREEIVYSDAGASPPLTPLQPHDAAFIPAGGFAHLAPAGGGGGGAAADDILPTLPPPPPAVVLQTYGRDLPVIFREEDEAGEAAVRAAAADEVFMELAAVPAEGGNFFGEPTAPPARRADARPASDDPNSVGRRVLLASTWMLTTLGAALANPLDYSRRDSRA